MTTERLQKIIAQSGIASRRAAEKLIVDGRVRVNGVRIVELGSKANLQHDSIEVDGLGALRKEALIYLAMHKPERVVSTVEDPEGRTTVVQLLQQSRALGPRRHEGSMPRVYPVGRLDFNAEGLILLTNDGQLTQGLLHPRHHVPKTYMVKVRGRPEARSLTRLRQGLRLRQEDGTWSRPTAPCEIAVVREGRSNSWLEMTLFEGRNHQVKRMCEAVGHCVVRLIRTHFGDIALDDLPAGTWRHLSAAEVKTLKGWPEATHRRRAVG